MSLEVLDFNKRDKTYCFEAGEFTLKPPYMSILNKARPLAKRIDELEGKSNTDEDSFNELVGLYLQLLKMVLEDIGKGSLDNLNHDNIRIDVTKQVLQDFFSHFNR